MEFRRLTADDSARLTAFYASLSDEVNWFYRPFADPTEEVLREHLVGGDEGRHIILGIVEDSGTIVGHAFILSVASEDPTFGIGLHQSVHGRGWGRKLTVAILEEADRLGLPLVTLTVMKENVRAKALYESLGFRLTGECDFRSPGDSWCMERRGPADP